VLPSLQILENRISPLVRADWTGVSAELLTASNSRSYEFRFDGPALYLCFGLSGSRKESIVQVDGKKPVHFHDVANRFHIVPAGAVFSGFTIPATTQRFVQVYLDPRAGILHPDLDLGQIAPRLAASDPRLMDTARKFEAAITAPQPMGKVYGETLGCLLGVELLRWQQGNRQPIRELRGGLTPNQMDRLHAFVRDHISDDLSLPQLAAVVGLSPWHFCRAFKQVSGEPPHRWLNRIRIERARELLACGQLSITDIALSVGFAGHSQFARVFRSCVGISPSAYRTQLR